VAFLDILAPPYDPNSGRDCTYYAREEVTAYFPSLYKLRAVVFPQFLGNFCACSGNFLSQDLVANHCSEPQVVVSS